MGIKFKHNVKELVKEVSSLQFGETFKYNDHVLLLLEKEEEGKFEAVDIETGEIYSFKAQDTVSTCNLLVEYE